LVLILNSTQLDTKTVALVRQSIIKRGMILGILVIVSVISSPVHWFLPTAEREYPLKHYTKLVSEEHFTSGRPLVIVLPLAEEDCTNYGLGYLIEELHTSGCWPILVYNVGYKMNGNMYREIQQHGSYIILISGPCTVWEFDTVSFWQQLNELFW
jgi:hypothetical protein